MKLQLAAAAVAGGLAIVPLVAAPAEAGTSTPGCISQYEFSVMQRGTMNWMQNEYTTGPGSVVSYKNNGKNIIKQYPWCNHSASQGFFQVAYDMNAAGQYMGNNIVWFNFT